VAAARELTIEPEALDALSAHAVEGYPHEVVGILAGSGSRITRAAPLVNERADSPHDRYHVSGLTLMRAERELEAQGFQILGYYHSHPDHPARYSETDRDAALPNLSYVIASVERGRVADVRSWRLRDDRSAMDEETLRTEERTL
jgi:proteasome lid subunit RPN8/RPN11